MDWIDVEKEKPKDREEVLIWDQDDFAAVAWWEENWNTWTWKSTGCGCCDDCPKPTHWMPLPNPPGICKCLQ